LTLDHGLPAAGRLQYLGDEHRVRQILVNLLTNAVKFASHGGRVTLESEPHEADGKAWILSRVRDDGAGVPPEDRERIFESFVQGGEAGLTRPFGGTGLGLPISRRLARLMGGAVTLEAADPGP